MHNKPASGGFSLIEAIFFIVVAGISMAGVIPLYSNVLTNQYKVSTYMQAEYLFLETAESLRAAYAKGAGFANITEANFPSRMAMDLGGTMRFDLLIEVEGMVPGQLPNPCTGQDYAGESYKCVTVTVRKAGSSEVLFRKQMLNADLLN
ncbi:MAG: hypothetical protein G8237_14685 [Magnetococcales bacterium]|nr:hypothetical protein [Magnetococcales bacterium]